MNGYRIDLKQGYIETDTEGRVTADIGRYRTYRCAPHDGWRILGISTRHHAHTILPLSLCADDPSVIGQGWIHDLDHGTHRLWGMPRGSRAVRVVRI